MLDFDIITFALNDDKFLEGKVVPVCFSCGELLMDTGDDHSCECCCVPCCDNCRKEATFHRVKDEQPILANVCRDCTPNVW